MKTEEEKQPSKQTDALMEEIRENEKELKATLAAAERAQAKLTRAGRHVEALQCTRIKAELERLIKQRRNFADTISELHGNKDLRLFLAKTMILCVSAIDLATYYADTVNKFFARHDVELKPEAVAIEEAGRKALADLRRFYVSRLRIDEMDEQATNFFDAMERLFAENSFTDRERVYYEEYSK